MHISRWDKLIASKRGGFTIVELLIVIVIIAILAAITIVAFNGVQKRASVARMATESNSLKKKLELFNIERNAYPSSITDCPTPAAGALCLNSGNDETYQYQANAPGGSGYLITDNPSYDLTVFGDKSFVYISNAARHGTNEFMQYTDLAPIIDRYGLGKYKISFDIKSADTTNKSVVNVYFQNGSTTRYGGLSQNIPLTTDYTHQEVTFTAALNNASVAQAMLAFYGTYSTGNIPTVKNVQIEAAL